MADPIADIKTEIATTGTDPLRWVFGGRLLTEDSILNTRGAGRGLALYDDLMRDAQVAMAMDKRLSALVGREWKIKPGDAKAPLAVQAAEMVADAFNGMQFSQATRKLLRAILHGVSICEVMWTLRGGSAVVPAMLLSRDPRRFMFRAVDGGDPVAGTAIELRLLTKTQVFDGIAVPARKFVVHRFGDYYENPWGVGVGHRLFWPVFFKRQGTSFWLNGLDKFSQPTVVGKYGSGTSEDEQKKLLEALAAVSREAGVAIPDGMTIDLLEAKRAGTFDAYESLARYMDGDIIKAILGETLTSEGGSGGGSRALGQVHNEVRLELVKSDADDLSDTLNAGLITWITDLNFPGYAASGLPYPTIWWDVAVPDDLLARAQRDVQIKSLGYEPTPEYITQTYGEGWVKAAAAPTPGAPADALQALFAEAGRTARRTRTIPVEGSQTSPADAADILTGQVGPMTAAPIAAWFGQLGALVDHAESMQDIADGLLALYPKLGTADLAEMIGQALAVGDLTGRVDLQDGAVPAGGDA